MKKLILTLAAFALIYSVALAADLTTTLPAGSFSAKMSKITANPPYDGSTDTWGTAVPLANMAFGTLVELTDTLGTPLAIFAPSDNGYYAIDIGFGGGGGMSTPPTVTVTYGGDLAMRQRVNTAYVQKQYGEATEAPATKLYMTDAVPTFVSQSASYQGGKWVRIYIGINTNWDSVADPSGNHVFTYATPSGTFSATMTISYS
ncbi:MAG: hypothetical protein JW788_06350 [Candidatus Omnitrophica bacterium]|nr:hypothetical protein [Candidatus Omnitrophota bacterium]